MTTLVQPLDEEEIRPADLMARKRDCLLRDRAFLLDRRREWVDVDCPACGSSPRTTYGEKNAFTYVECSACQTVYTSPRPSLTLLQEFYASSENYAFWNAHIFPATEATRRQRIFRPRAERIHAICDAQGVRGTLVEVGAAFGIFCEEAVIGGHFDRVIAIEPTPDLAETCRHRGLSVWETTIEEVTESQVADVICAFEVIEHLFSPADFLRHARRLLRPGGLLIVTCPNVRGFDVAFLRTQSGTFDHEHLNYFHPTSLAGLVKRAELEVLDVATPGQLDAGIVRQAILDGSADLAGNTLLEEILVRRWEELGGPFQQFLADNCLSSHLWLVARKPA
jgi:2-polyprenyl-3-methyl-5-hydroxy-6-metoxy-1,4-benzoquinol methylase/ribosomal protein S27E